MLQTLPREFSLAQRVLAIAAFSTLTALGAQLEVRIGDLVPFTMQVFAVLLAGMVLGGRDGALSQLVYILLIGLNLPIAAGGAGVAALTGPTAGYLIGFIAAAFVVGWLVERGTDRAWQRWLTGLVGVAIIYACGLPVLMSVAKLSFDSAWAAGAAPFIPLDVIKAALAATLSAGGRALLRSR